MPNLPRRLRFVLASFLGLLAVAIVSWLVLRRDRVQIVPAGRISNPAVVGAKQIDSFDVSAAVDGLAWFSGGRQLAVLTKKVRGNGSQRRTVLTYDLESKTQVVLNETGDVLQGLVTSPSGDHVFSSSWRSGTGGACEILAWGLDSNNEMLAMTGPKLDGLGVTHTSDPVALAVSPNGKLVAAGCKLVDAQILHGGHIGGEVCVWDIAKSELKWSDQTTHTDIVYAVAFSPDSTMLASAGVDKLIRIWRVETGELESTLVGAAWRGITSLAYSPDGKILASGGSGEEDGGCVRVWSVEEGKVRHFLRPFRMQSQVRLTFAPAGNALFAVGPKKGADQPVSVVDAWDASTGEHVGVLAELGGAARCIAVSADGRRLAVGTFEGQIHLIELSD